MRRVPRVILSGGGTGGHIYPAIAIANEIKARYPKAEILFVGAEDKMEMQKVPEAGYEIEGLWISGIQRKLSFKNLILPFKLISSLWKSRRIIKRFKPDVVIGTGGFASGAVVTIAAKCNLPTLIQEQNSFPGITNKLLAKSVDKICVAYDGLDRFFPESKIIKTGNPVREDLLEVQKYREEAFDFYGLDKDKKVLLVLGGSLGAKRINELIESHLSDFKNRNIQLIWQCGKLYSEQYVKYESQGILVVPFIEKMNLAYAVADVIISRAGASSISELALVGKATLFIPSPNVAEDHQTKNANSVVNNDGALLVKETELEESFLDVFDSVFVDVEKQKRLGGNFKKMALPNATKDIVDQIESIMQK